jgi:hypothetical protein
LAIFKYDMPDFQIGQHLSKNLVICWVKARIHQRQLKLTVG